MRAAMQRTRALRIVLRILPLFFAANALAAARAVPQGSRADYERAAELAKRFAGAVRNARVDVHWLEAAPRLWFADERFDGAARWRIVDAERGTNEAVFDERFVAAARAKGWEGAPARVHALGLDDFGARLGERDVRWARASGELSLASDAPHASDRAGDLGADFGPSRDGEECVVTFVNERASAVELMWIDGRGRRRSYGELEPGAERTQRTFDGHNWLVRDAQGRDLGAARARLGVERIRIGPQDLGELSPSRPVRLEPGRSPDGRWMLAVRGRDLHLVGADGIERQLTQDGSESDAWSGPLAWSPDSTRFVAWKRTRGGDRRVHYIESAPRDSVQPKLNSYAYLKPGDELPQSFPHLFEVGTGLESCREIALERELFAQPWSIDRLEWERDSSAFSFLYNERGHRVMRVVRVDATNGKARAIVDERCATFFDYAHKTFLHRVAGGRELLWMSERSGWNHLYRIDARSGEVLGAVTAGEWVVRGVVSTNDELRELVLRVGGRRAGEDPYHEHFVRVGYDGGEPLALTEGDGTHELAFSPDGRFYVDRWSRVDHAPVSELRRASDGTLVCELARADTAELQARGWREPQRFVAKGRDGATDIWGVVFRPTNFDPERRYAVVEQIYAGPHGAHTPKRFAAHHGRAQELAELGFVVVQLDGMGTNGRSKAFHDVAWKNLADAGFPDRIAWLRALAAAHPEVDLSRVGIYGGSAGGQNALRALIDHGDFYRAAVADCGCHDNRMDKVWWNELWMSWPVGPHYEESSNVVHAARMQGELLLIVGEADENVDPASTLQVVDALIRADKDFELLVMPGVGHGAGGTPYGWRRTCDFLVRKLYGVDPRRP